MSGLFSILEGDLDGGVPGLFDLVLLTQCIHLCLRTIANLPVHHF